MLRGFLCPTRQRPTHRPGHPSSSSGLVIDFLVRGKHHSRLKSKRRSPTSQKWLERQHKDPYVKRANAEGLPSRASFKLQEINEVHFPALQNKTKGKGSNPNKQKRNRLRLIRPGMHVLDLGAAPGSWSLYASTQLTSSTVSPKLVAVDLQPLSESNVSSRIMANSVNFEFIQGDFTQKQTRMQIMDSFHLSDVANDSSDQGEICSGRQPGLILSDMAPNFSGDSQTDAIQTLNLCEQALAFAVGNDCFDPSYGTKETEQGILADGGSFLCKYFQCGKENESDLREAATRAFQTVHVMKPKASRKESSEMYMLALGFNRKRHSQDSKPCNSAHAA